ncbi:MAG: ABC transporter transmembrane domain-containing protein [Magnetovibrionaceae bacterium]
MSSPDPTAPLPRHRTFWPFITGYLKPYGSRAFLALAALLITAAASLSVGLGLRHLVDSGLSTQNIGALTDALLWLLAIGATISLGSFARFYLMTWLGERIVADLRHDLFKSVIHREIAFFESRKTGELLSRITTDTTLVQTVIGSSLSMAIRNCIILAGSLTMMVVTSPKLALACLLIVPVVVALVLFFGRRVRKLSREAQDRVADVGAFAEESFNAIRTVKAFNQEQGNMSRFDGEVGNAFATALRRATLRGFQTASVSLTAFCGLGAVLFLGGQDLLSGEISAGDLTAFLFYAVMVSFAAGVVSEVYGDLERARGALERIVDLLQEKPSEGQSEVSRIVLPHPGRIEMRNVSFTYASRPGRPALDDISFTIQPGETIALVGPSGAGKSTVFQLLLRFYQPDSGTIAFGGRDILSLPPSCVRSSIALVPQEPFIFGGNAMDNIRYGRQEATDEDVIRAARRAMADGFIRDLPQGYDTYLGEKGVRLSGGQKQRIAIARAILRDAPILLLDEATSALDSENERLVQEALQLAMKGRTTVAIAHRLSTIINATRIFVLDQGRLVAQGQHEELLETSALYAAYASRQLGQD